MSYYLYIRNIYLYQYHDTKPNPINIDWLLGLTPTNLTLHFSGTLLGSARGTGLLPICGRNLYNCLCSFFLCSFHLSAAQRFWTHLDSELLQTLTRSMESATQETHVFTQLWAKQSKSYIFDICNRNNNYLKLVLLQIT